MDAQRTQSPQKNLVNTTRVGYRRKITAENVGKTGWQGMWRIAVVNEMLSDAGQARMIDQMLKNPRIAPAEFAVITLLQAADGYPIDKVEERLKDTRLQETENDPAVELLRRVISLLSPKTPSEFVDAAVEALNQNLIPAEVVYWLHFQTCGVRKDIPANEALALLERYPEDLRKKRAFKELRLALLDSYAHFFWEEGRLRHARLLWDEMLSLDSLNIPAEHNIALLAARTRDQATYAASWSRAMGLRYLYAAAAEDVQVHLEERKALHLAIIEQSFQRHIKHTPDKVTPEELASWLKDTAAFEVWLGEWPLYYLNNRLAFNSPVQVLGIAYDAADAELDAARQYLTGLIDKTLAQKSWPGIKTFCALAQERIDQSVDAARNVIMRARDPYYEMERANANALLQEVLGRMSFLDMVIQFVAEKPTNSTLDLAYQSVVALLSLPLYLLDRVLKEMGKLERNHDLVEVFANRVLQLIQAEDIQSLPVRKLEARLSILDECAALAPNVFALKFTYVQVLLLAKRWDRAYDAAVALLETLPKPGDDIDLATSAQENEKLRTSLQNIIDNAAIATIPEEMLQPKTIEEVNATIEVGKEALNRFPKAHGLRKMLVNLLEKTSRSGEASRLIEAGIPYVDSEKEIRDAEHQMEALAAYEEIDELIKQATTAVNAALEAFNQDNSAENLEALRNVVLPAIPQIERAWMTARTKKLTERAQQAEALLKNYKQMRAQLQENVAQNATAERIGDLLNGAVEAFTAAQKAFDEEKSLPALVNLESIVDHGIADAQQAKQLAKNAGIKPYIENADHLIKQFQDVKKQIKKAKRS